jgi:hypothetical protein
MRSALRLALTRLLPAFLAVILLSSWSSRLLAQDVASLTGVLADTSGAVIADATVKLVDTKTNTAYQTRTNAIGVYSFAKLPPGPDYRITYSKDGFETVAISGVYLSVGITHTQNATMSVGKTTETVEVQGAGSAVTLNTTDASVGNNFDMNMVHELPIQVRDGVLNLLRFQPGVVSALGADEDPNSTRDGAMTGARTDQTNITVDGLDVNDFNTGQSLYSTVNAPADSVQEFRSEVANPLSDEGRGSGSQVSLVTKSGTNKFHGSAYEYNRNTDFEANDFFNNFAGVPRAPLIRNQFGGSIGGPILKDKLFFFFNYQARRDVKQAPVLATVPTDSFAAGNIAYINSGGGVSVLPAAGAGESVQNFDPLGIGADPALTTFIQGRYPHPNSTAVGDGLNTSGFQFNAPANQSLNDYVARVDYNLGSKMKIFARGSLQRETDDRVPSIAFPGDPLTFVDNNHSWAAVVGHTWTISNTKVNQFIVGETKQEFNFPFLFNPTGTTQFNTFDATGTGGAFLSSPYFTPASQDRAVAVPVFRDDFTYVRGAHTFQAGGNFKPVRSFTYLLSDLNGATLGLGGGITGLAGSSTQLQPSDLATDPVSQNLYDSAFTFILGRFGGISSNFNNNAQLQPIPQGTGHKRNYRYNETEVYLQDGWRARTDLTLSYGVRYQFYSVPYEVNGLEAIPNLDFAQVMNPRLNNGAAGLSGAFQNPIITYSLGGKANHAPALYHPDWHDFQPHFALAFNPARPAGFFGRLLGDRKTVIRMGASIVDDHTAVGALNFLQDQNTWVLQNSTSTTFGLSQDPSANLAADPRFTSITSLPPGSVVPPPAITTPFSPAFVDQPALGGPVPFGLASFPPLSNYTIDPNLKTPYSETFTLGFQRELPGNFQLDAAYFGRFAHRLLAQADALQTVNFIDPASKTDLASQFALLSLAARNNQPIPSLPFFENQMNPVLTRTIGSTCEGIGFSSCADLVNTFTAPLPARGDLSDTIEVLNIINGSIGGLINPGVGLNPQFGSSLYVTNKSYSNYNGLLATLHKKMSRGLQFDVNYTWSHSIDDISDIANQSFGSNGAGGILCDSINLGVCRGNSDFDVQHGINGDLLYMLPVGRGRAFGSTLPRWADEVIGGWQISGLMNWRTGLAFQSVANAFPLSFANNVPAIFNGDTSALKTNVHAEINSATGAPSIQLFSNQTAALGAFSGPLGLQAGSRNNLRGPHFSNFDIGLAKHFRVTESVTLEFRADAFNVFNHTNFELPGAGEFAGGGTADITSPSTFGVITGDAGPRTLQVSLRLDF